MSIGVHDVEDGWIPPEDGCPLISADSRKIPKLSVKVIDIKTLLKKKDI